MWCEDILYSVFKFVGVLVALVIFSHVFIPVSMEFFINLNNSEKQEVVTCTVLSTNCRVRHVGYSSYTDYDIAVLYNDEVYVIDDRDCFYLYQSQIGQEVSALLVTYEFGKIGLSSEIKFPEMLSEWEINPFLNKSQEKERGKANVK